MKISIDTIDSRNKEREIPVWAIRFTALTLDPLLKKLETLPIDFRQEVKVEVLRFRFYHNVCTLEVEVSGVIQIKNLGIKEDQWLMTQGIWNERDVVPLFAQEASEKIFERIVDFVEKKANAVRSIANSLSPPS